MMKDSKLKHIIFTGGGSGGHVIPALCLIRLLKKEDYGISYVGREEGIEFDVVNKEGVEYHSICSGKLRRYFSLENIVDIFKLGWGVIQSLFLLRSFRKKDTLIFSTGGFVALPLVIGAGLCGFFVIIHEQTARAGLANRISSFFADKILLSFKSAKEFFPKKKTIITGYPLRDDFYKPVKSLEIFSEINRPVLFVSGGGNGSKLINEVIRKNLDHLKKKYFIIHQTGMGSLDEFESLKDDYYHPLGFIGNEIISYYYHSNIVISRAGAGTVCELTALGKKSIFIPLAIAQKNEQYHNAMEAKKSLGSTILTEDEFKQADLISLLDDFKSAPISSVDKGTKNPAYEIIREIKSYF